MKTKKKVYLTIVNCKHCCHAVKIWNKLACGHPDTRAKNKPAPYSHGRAKMIPKPTWTRMWPVPVWCPLPEVKPC